mgnify:CR=1 FL=1
MKKAVKVTALLFTSAFLLGACGQDKKEETTVATTQATTTTTTPTTATPTTATPTTVAKAKSDMPADAKKTVFEASAKGGTETLTVYYKDDVLLKQETVEVYTLSQLEVENALEKLQNNTARTKETLKDFIGKGFEYNTEHKGDIFTITYSFDYTKIDLDKLKEKIPGLDLRDDKTLSYSAFKEGLLKGGYKEKQ